MVSCSIGRGGTGGQSGPEQGGGGHFVLPQGGGMMIPSACTGKTLPNRKKTSSNKIRGHFDFMGFSLQSLTVDGQQLTARAGLHWRSLVSIRRSGEAEVPRYKNLLSA